MIPWGQDGRRKRLTQSPWPTEWNTFLAATAHAWVLTAVQISEWRRLIRILVAEKNWEGADGFGITDQVKVTVSSQAALPLLAMPHDFYASVRSVVVFPSAFELPLQDWQRKPQAVLGAAPDGAVLLAWDKALAESRDVSSGRNLTIHEFAHHLDFQDGYWNGCPELHTRAERKQWYEAMKDAFADVSRDLSSGAACLFAAHAATNPAEFFAEASERFFVAPLTLRQHYLKVYAVLEAYYRLSPSEWFKEQLPES